MALNTLMAGEGAGTITQGQRLTSAIGSSRKQFQYIDKFINNSEYTCPLYVLMKRLGNTKTVGGALFNHLETDRMPQAVQGDSATYTSGVTTINLLAGHGVRVVPGNVLKNPRSAEMIRITDRATDALTVTRGFGGTTAASVSASDEWTIIGFADTEGNTAQSGISSEPAFVQNAVQTFRQSFEMSRRDMDSSVYGPKEKVRIMQDAADALTLQIEKTYLFSNGIATTNPTATAGLEYWVTTNVTNASGALSEATWNTFLKNCSRRNYNRKNILFLAGELLMDALDGFGRDLLRYGPKDEFHGIKCTSYKNAHIDVNLMKHCLLSPVGSGVSAANSGWQGYGFFVNLDLIGRAVYSGGDWKLRSDIEANGTDGKKWEYLTDEGLYVMNEKAHGIIKGISG